MIWLSSSAAAADPTPAQQKELARNLMHNGYAARSAHDLKLALRSFKAADDIMHVPTTGFEVARSQADLGMLVEAHETLVETLHLPEKPDEPQAFTDARRYARAFDQQLVGRIPQLRIEVTGASSPAVSVDDVALPDGGLLVPYKVNPGHHVVVATAGGETARAETDVAESEVKQVSISLRSPPRDEPVGPTPESPPSSGQSEKPTPRRPGFGLPAWIASGFTVVAVGVGAVTGVMTLNDRSAAQAQCNGTRCSSWAYSTFRTANTLSAVSTVSFAVGGVGLGAVAVAWLSGWGVKQPSATPSGKTASIEPWIGLGSAGVSGSF